METNTKTTAIIAGNHLINDDGSMVFETKAMEHALTLLNEQSEFVLFFDQFKLQIPKIISTKKSLPLTHTKFFLLKEELPNNIPAESRMIFENSLRNYARRMYEKAKQDKETNLTRAMYNDSSEITQCNCVGAIVSLLELLYKSYEKIIWVEEINTQRVKIPHLLQANIVFPKLQIIWV